MIVDVDLSHVSGAAVGLGGAFWAMGKMLLLQTQKQIEAQFKLLNEHIAAQDKKISELDLTNRRIEREVMELKVDLPKNYVRREDYVQAVAMIMTKLDALQLYFQTTVLELTQRQRDKGAL